jgi:Tfp pilus assembly protein FimT
MALLSIVISVSVPSLAGFFRGRTLDAEARRLLSLSRHGQSRAVSEGIPMLLWFDAENRSYGLERQPGWEDQDSKAVEFTLDENLKMEVVETNVLSPTSLRGSRLGADAAATSKRNLPQIKFLPDGSIDETSPPLVRLLDKDGVVVSLRQDRNRLNYEIQTQPK